MMANDDCIVGIDLGTTNSEVAAYFDGKVQVLGANGNLILPSCVGLTPEDKLLVGEAARNQHLLYPERTVRSIKRKMGSNTTVLLGAKSFTPQEISAIILRELAGTAARVLGRHVNKAVITVPAYFSDAQRQATREAGALAGLEVVRILNEPTAASLAYGFGDAGPQTVMVYDLGGGTFDVSVVTIEGDVTEVLASHGNNELGGDDFDDLLVDLLADEFEQEHGINLREGQPVAYSRLWWAAEEAKKQLSAESYTVIREEALVMRDGTPLHLEREISRQEFEQLIRPLVDQTMASVSKALNDAGKRPKDIDAVLLVGGSTRTPLILKEVETRLGLSPHQDVHPDLCVALGAGVLASRLAGHEVERVLVDVSPFSFGVSYLGIRHGYEYPFCYHPIIHRNTALPVTRSDAYQTSAPYQTGVDITVYQGDDEDALKNIPVGEFKIEGLKPTAEPNAVLCRMTLDIDGILHVTAIEKETGLSKHITIDNALQPKSDKEIEEARERLGELFADRGIEDDDYGVIKVDPGATEDGALEMETETPEDTPGAGQPLNEAFRVAAEEACQLIDRSRSLSESMHEDDREEAINLHEAIGDAIESKDNAALTQSVEALKELLFFVEGRA